MTDDQCDALIDAGTSLLGIAIAPEWRTAIRQHLVVSLEHGVLVTSFALPDNLDPAPVFQA